MTDHSKLDILLRRNRGLRIRPNWVASFREATGIDLMADAFLGVAETRMLRERFYAKLRAMAKTHMREWSKDDLGRLVTAISELADRSESPSVVLLSSVDQYIGAVRVPAHVILRHVEAIWGVVGEDLCLTTDDLRDGMCLESDYLTSEGEFRREGLFRLTSWGKFSLLSSNGGDGAEPGDAHM